MIKRRLHVGVALAALIVAWGSAGRAADGPTPATKPDVAALAKLFGGLPRVRNISLSPDGKQAVIVSPGPNLATYAIVIDAETRAAHVAGRQDGKPMRLLRCGWASNSRIVCGQYGVAFDNDPPIPYTRTVAFDADGKNALYIGRQTSFSSERLSQYDGKVIDWLQGDGHIIMTRDYVPEYERGTFPGRAPDGIGVDRVDTMTAKGDNIERPDSSVSDYISDGQGNVRIKAVNSTDDRGMLNGGITYFYRPAGESRWKTFSKTKEEADAFTPVAVDGGKNLAYAVKPLDGRDAIYSVSLDGNFTAQLVASNPQVDVDDVITIGRHGRVIGVSYTTDRLQTDYFDPEYKKLAVMLGKALPSTPLIHIMSASADEQRLIIFAGSDVDPGHYYIYDKPTHHLNELIEDRPELDDMTMAPMKSVTFKAKDGTVIPAYLTLPPSGESKNLPVIVMPHGGPDYRDEWGFDWMVQFFAQRGFAVLQPEFRGSSGYGASFGHNALKNWQLAMSDVCDAGRWLVKEGIADPSKLAIMGWSYGGYAALQANVVEPTLFKAIVAVAPVTDLGRVKAEARGYTNSAIVNREVGSGETIDQGSPARHADRIAAPVLIFHGDQDINVALAQSKAMDQALHRAGKASTLVVYPGLDHQLEEAGARADMLSKADTFLRASLRM
jgi:dipeptidyl aminopeptidase/acylaminoacyl peptidase